MKGNGRVRKYINESNVYVFFAGAGRHPLKQVFDIYIEEEISEEQVERVLEPVLKKIYAGAFSRPGSKFRLAGATLSVFAMAIITAFVTGN